MRLVTFEAPSGALRAGALVDDDAKIVDLASAAEGLGGGRAAVLGSVLAIIEAGEEGLDAARAAVARASGSSILPRRGTRLRAPVPTPAQMRDTSSFDLHLRQSAEAGHRLRAQRAEDPEAALRDADRAADEATFKVYARHPVYYKCNRFSVIGPDEDIVWPSYAKWMDFELEFGVFLTGRAKDVSPEAAKAHIFGYTVFNDVSARDTQFEEMGGRLGPAKGKDFDTGNVLGPCLVTADELGDDPALTMVCRVNGEEWGRGSSADMRWSFGELISYVSRSETLHPGEFIGSGAIGGGTGWEHLRQLKAGDVIELEVEGIGILKNRLVKPT